MPNLWQRKRLKYHSPANATTHPISWALSIQTSIEENLLVAHPLGKLLNPSLNTFLSLCKQISTSTMTHNLSKAPITPPTMCFSTALRSGVHTARKLGRGLPVRFLTPMQITIEVARLTPRPRREALREWSFWTRFGEVLSAEWGPWR